MNNDSKKRKCIIVSICLVIVLAIISCVFIKKNISNDNNYKTTEKNKDTATKTEVIDKTTEAVTTEKSKADGKKNVSISGGVKKDKNTKESKSDEKSDDKDIKTPERTTEGTTERTTEYTGGNEEPTTQRQVDNDGGGSTTKPPKKDDGKKNQQPTTQTPTTEEATREPVTEKPTSEEPATEHEHNWVAVKHEAEVKPAWREEVHTTEEHVMCTGCGEDLDATGHAGDYQYYNAHVRKCQASYTLIYVDVVSYVDHPEEIIKSAYTSYKCSTCGATK